MYFIQTCGIQYKSEMRCGDGREQDEQKLLRKAQTAANASRVR